MDVPNNQMDITMVNQYIPNQWHLEPDEFSQRDFQGGRPGYPSMIFPHNPRTIGVILYQLSRPFKLISHLVANNEANPSDRLARTYTLLYSLYKA
jgi:hypothetical protein